MATPDIHHLSSLDAAFLHIESAEMPMHVGSAHVLELPRGYDGDFYEEVKAHVGARMHLARVFTRKLALMPFDLSNPVWVEDEDIDLDHHVRHVVLPRPGTWEQLERLVARLHSQLLDRSRPLWEMTLIEGLQTGERVLYAKAHHAGLDGQAGVAVGKALFDLEPSGRVVKKPRPKQRSNQYQLGMAELAGAAFTNTVRQVVELIRATPAIASAVKQLVLPPRGPDGKRPSLKPEGGWFAPRTPFNVSITNQRSWAARTLPLAEVKAVAKAHGCTLNDVVLALCSGALRRYLSDYDVLPKASLRAAVPVSLRQAGDESANNQVAGMLLTLASDVKDPIERLRTIGAASKRTKTALGGSLSALPLDLPILGAPWVMSSLASMYGRSRLANSLPQPANVAISNVPGVPVPIYFAGAAVHTYYPVSIPGHGIALNITVNSYNGRLDFGLIACRRAVPDIDDMADHLLTEHKLLCELTAKMRPVAEPAKVQPINEPAKPPAPARKAVLKAVPAAEPAAAKPVRVRQRRVRAAA